MYMSERSENRKFYLVLGISFLLMILIGKLPPFGQMTEYGMQFLGVFVGCIFGWICGVNVPVCLLGIVMAGFLINGQTVDNILIAVQSTQNILMLFWALIFGYGLGQCGLLNFVANKIMGIKLCTKSPWHLAVSLWLCTMICTAFSHPFATLVLMFSTYYSVAEKIGAQKRSNYTGFVLVVIAAIAVIGVGAVPYSTMIIMALSIMSAAVPGIEYNIPIICVVNIFVTLGTIVVVAILFKILLQTKIIKVEFDMSRAGNLVDSTIGFDTKVKWGFFYIILLVVSMVLPNFLPAGSALAVLLGRIGTLGKFMFVVMLMCLTTVDGKRILDLEKAIKNGAVNWQIYFIMGTALVISGQLVTEEAGLALTIKGALGGLTGNMGIYTLCLAFLIIGLALTNCITNVVAMQLIIPILSIFMMEKGVNPAVIVGLAGIVLDHGLVLPSGSPVGAYIHGNGEWMTSKQCYLFATCAAICLAISIAVIGVPMALAFS